MQRRKPLARRYNAPPPPRSTHGSYEQKRARKELLAAHKEGTPCPRCGQPMYTTQALDAGHSVARIYGGQKADRLEHASCNRKDGGIISATRQGFLKPTADNPTSENW